MKESLYKSITEIMAFFDFEKVAQIEEQYFNETCKNYEDTLVDEIKEFALSSLYEYAKEFSSKMCDCWASSCYHLRFEYVHDEDKPRMEMKYIPIAWEE